jgi:peptide deformylase
MPAKRIRLLGDPLLRQISMPVNTPEEALRITGDLRDTLHQFQRTHGFGRGISAVQIGEPSRVIYIEFEGSPYELIHPACVSKSSETFELWDDCFSFPDLLVRVRRHRAVRVEYLDPAGHARVVEAEGAFSELLQHELDHLDGVLAVDRAIDGNSLCLRQEWERRHRVP